MGDPFLLGDKKSSGNRLRKDAQLCNHSARKPSVASVISATNPKKRCSISHGRQESRFLPACGRGGQV
jgi:hypothetical protein